MQWPMQLKRCSNNGKSYYYYISFEGIDEVRDQQALLVIRRQI